MITKNKVALGFLSFIVLLSLAIRAVNFFAPPEPGYINFRGHVYPVLVPLTNEQKFTGLSGRKDLGKYFGMYFAFEKQGVYTMVMRDMLIPLDMVWLSDNKIVEIKPDLQPEPGKLEDQLTRYFNAANLADAVIELPAGTAKFWGMKPGESMIFCLDEKTCRR
ncbi:MAG: DUF192 domain-containing protein [Patescibacteria group bacterium]|jgi:uncharacterized membrane protein (UPF0127 family)